MSLIFGLLLACTGGPGKTIECVDNGNCPEGQACVEAACTDVECLTNNDCGLENVCTDDYACESGCEESDDCLAGYFCDDGECEAEECEVTELDCAIGEVCKNGNCKDYPGDLCNSCSSDLECGGGSCQAKELQNTCSSQNQCSGGSTCTPFLTGTACSNDNQCGGGGAYCDWFYGQCVQSYCATFGCLPPCSGPNDDSCPAGFECVEAGFGYVCSGDCWTYENL